MDGLASDKVNINVGDGGGGRGYDGGAGLAAVIAALGNRNQGNDNASLIAALGNRNDSGANWAPALAMLGNRHDEGMGALWPIILLALLGRRGFGGGDDCNGHGHGDGISPGLAALLQTLTEGQSSLRAEVPTSALEIQNAIQGAIGALALGTQQGFANTKDAVQNGITFLGRDLQLVNQNVSDQGCQGREVTMSEGDKTRFVLGAKIDKLEDRVNSIQENNLQRELAVTQSALAEERGNRRVREVEVNVSQVVSQNQAQQQAQAQLQAQFGQLFAALNGIANQVQRVRADQDVINFGTMAASGNQATTSTQVR